MVDSEKSRFWNLDRAEGAVKGAFFAQEILSGESPDEPHLHFSEIRGLIEKNERAIGDRTLSKALSSLVAKRQITKAGVGKQTVYTLDLPRIERVRAFARADATWVSRSAEIGGLGDGEKGFAYYGLPEASRERYRRRLQRAALSHQADLRNIVSEAWEEAENAVLRPTRRRVPKQIWRTGAGAVRRMSRLLLAGSLGQGYAARLWEMLEGTFPGALTTYQKTLAVSFAPETPLPDRMATVVSKIAGIDRDEIQPEMDRLLTRTTRDSQRTLPLWDALTPSEKDRAGRLLGAAVAMTGSLTSVVHA